MLFFPCLINISGYAAVSDMGKLDLGRKSGLLMHLL